jgi:phage terminase large subunit-like protein
MRALATKARNMPSAAAQFKQKRLNIWVNTDAPWLSLEGWRAGQTTWSLEDMRGRACWIGVDLSSKIDLAAAAFAFPPATFRRKPAPPADDVDEDDEADDAAADAAAAAAPLEPWRFHVRSYTPADTLLERARRDRAPYEQWVEGGHLITTPGNRIDQDAIFDDLLATAKTYELKVRATGFDPWNAGTIEKDLENAGFVVVEVPQTFAHLSGPAKEYEADVLDGKVDVGGNPLVAWNAANAVVQRDGKDNIQPIKKRSRGRIDGVVASLIARKLAAGSDDFERRRLRRIRRGAGRSV